MTSMKIDLRALTDFGEQLEDVNKQKEKERKQFIRKQGTELRRRTVREARASVGKKAVSRRRYTRRAGQYHKSIKRGRYYKYRDDSDCIRVYSPDKIAHLIELGFVPVLRNHSRGPKVAGKNVFEKAGRSFESTFAQACDEFVVGYKGAIER